MVSDSDYVTFRHEEKDWTFRILRGINGLHVDTELAGQICERLGIVLDFDRDPESITSAEDFHPRWAEVMTILKECKQVAIPTSLGRSYNTFDGEES